LLIAGLLATMPVETADAFVHAGGPTLRQLVGQRVIARMEGSAPSASFLARIRRGEIGGVFVFQNNFPAGGLRVLVTTLQNAAREGHQLPLLIATDQEGGGVRRLPGPPLLAPRGMTTGVIAQAQGRLTGTYLRSFGINTDLAPVLDVPEAPGAFIAPRSFGTSAAVVSDRGVAFA
jgi:beta-N-acetylhexosaminidase